MKHLHILILSIGFFALVGCGKTEIQTFEFSTEFTFDGPLFEGPNTAQYTLESKWSSFLQDQQITANDVKSVTLKSATVTLDPSFDIALISDLGLTFAADQIEMVQVGGLNPMNSGMNQVELKIGNDINITPFFKQPKFIFLLDAGFTEELYDNYTASARFNFEVEVKVK